MHEARSVCAEVKQLSLCNLYFNESQDFGVTLPFEKLNYLSNSIKWRRHSAQHEVISAETIQKLLIYYLYIYMYILKMCINVCKQTYHKSSKTSALILTVPE